MLTSSVVHSSFSRGPCLLSSRLNCVRSFISLLFAIIISPLSTRSHSVQQPYAYLERHKELSRHATTRYVNTFHRRTSGHHPIAFRYEEEHRDFHRGADEALGEGLAMKLLSVGSVAVVAITDRRIAADVRLSNFESVAIYAER